MACSGTGKGEIVRAIHGALHIRARYKGLGQTGGGKYSESSDHLFLRWQIKNWGILKIKIKIKNRGRGDASSVRLEYHWTFLSCCFFFLTSIAAYGVTPHIKSVSAVTGQDRPRPRFPAGPIRGEIKLEQPFEGGKKKKKKYHPDAPASHWHTNRFIKMHTFYSVAGFATRVKSACPLKIKVRYE